MTRNGNCFVEWKEQFISQERGNRVVHYFLKDSAGESILAVVGTERSVRHMFYVVAEEFVQVYGDKNSIHAGFKWRSRREVVDWLTSMLSKQHLQGDRSRSPQALDSTRYAMNGFGAQQMQGRFSRNLGGHDSDIVWSGVAWTCGKQLKHYPAFCRNATTIAIQSFVFVMAKGENHYLAYLEDMYEDKKGQKKVKVRWFHHNEEVKGVVPLRNTHPNEVFITPYSQVISAECVDGPAAVLTREHYEECLAAFPNALSARIHLCFRQFRSNKVKPFDLSKLRGYFDQPILSCLNSRPFLRADGIARGLSGKEDEPIPSENLKVGAKRARYCLSGTKLFPLKPFECLLLNNLLFKVDEKIEVLCQDSGIRGCWFRCTVLQVSRKQMKVQYDDVQDEDEYGNLEEWIPALKLAVPDKLGMRHTGRPIIRPAPPSNEQIDLALVVGSAVDAWWSDGWWEGVVAKLDNSGSDLLQVYFPGENFFLDLHKKDLRISRDWSGTQWIDIQAKPDILSAISATINPYTKTYMSIINKNPKADGVAMSCIEVPISIGLDVIEDKKPDSAPLTSSDSHLEAMDCTDSVQPPLLNCVANEDGGDEINMTEVICEGEVVGNDEVQVNDEGGEGEVAGTDEGRGNNEGEVTGDAKDKLDKLGVDVFETSQTNCEVIELMEVTA